MITLRLDKNGGINKGDIKAFEHDNLSETYIIQLYKNGEVYDLTNKTIELTMVEKKRKIGDILNLPIYNATEGKVKLEVVSDITKQDGTYDFKITIKGLNGLIETFPNFQVKIKNDITDSITGEIIQDPKFTILVDGLKALADYNIYKENALKVPDIENGIVELGEQLDKNMNNITRISESLTTPFNFKGSCLFSELPQTANVNDTWYLTDNKYRVSWTGDSWEQSSFDEFDYTDELDSIKNIMGEYTLIQNNLFQRENLIQYGSATIEGSFNTYIITPNDYGGVIVNSQIFNLNYEKIYISFICKSSSDLVIQLLNSGNGYLGNLITIDKSEGYQFINLSFSKSEIEAITTSNIIKIAFGCYSDFTLLYPVVSTVNNLESDISNDISKIYDIFTKNTTRISKVMGDTGINYSLSVFGDSSKIRFEQSNDVVIINSSDYGGVKLNETINVNYIDNLYISAYVESDSYIDVSFLNSNLGFISGVRVQVPKNSNLINLSFSKSELIAKGITSTFIVGFASYSTNWSISNLVISSKNNFQGTLTKELNKINNSLVKLFEYEESKPYEGMKILSLGDSFTFLNYYGKYLAKETGCIQRGRGQNGGELSTFCRDTYTGSDGQPKSETFDSNLLNQYDIITVMGGTNDFGNEKTPLGTIDDTKDMQTIYGSVKKIIDTIKSIKPSMPIIFCTQPHRFGYSHGIQTINGYDRNSQGVTMTDINNAIIETCSRYGVPCFDYASISDWNEYTITDFENCKYTYDGLHPKDGDGNGADILGTSFGHFINNLKLF